MKSLSELIEQYANDYANFIGRPFNKENHESLELFFQYVQTRILLNVSNIIVEQNNKIDKIIEVLKPDSK